MAVLVHIAVIIPKLIVYALLFLWINKSFDL
jgi:hypothetical protein